MQQETMRSQAAFQQQLEAAQLLAKKKEAKLIDDKVKLEQLIQNQQIKAERKSKKDQEAKEQQYQDEVDLLKKKLEKSHEKAVEKAVAKAVEKANKTIQIYEKKAEVDKRNLEALTLTESQQVITLICPYVLRCINNTII